MASSPQEQRRRQQMLSALLDGLPPISSSVPKPAAAPAPVPHPGLPVWNPVADAVAASREAIFRSIALLAGQQMLDRGRTEAFL